MFHLFVIQHELTCSFLDIVTAFGNGQRNDTDILVGDLVNHRFRIFHRPKQLY